MQLNRFTNARPKKNHFFFVVVFLTDTFLFAGAFLSYVFGYNLSVKIYISKLNPNKSERAFVFIEVL